MSSRKRVEQLVRSLVGFETVVRPDHPFLMVGPDLLVAGKAALVGVFVVKVEEERAPDVLLARMALSRLAFPKEYRTAVVLPTKDDAPALPWIAGELSQHFDVVLQGTDRLQLREYLSNRTTIPSNKIVPDEVRRSAFEQAEVLYASALECANDKEEARLRSRGTLPPNTPLSKLESRPWADVFSHYRSRAAGSPRGSIEVYKVKGFNVRLDDLSMRHRAVTLVRFGRAVFAADHTLDQGIPYSKRLPLNIVLSATTPIDRADPWKWLRTAAFSGFSIQTPSEPDTFQRRLEAMEKVLSEKQ